MADSLSSIGSIAIHIVDMLSVSDGVSGNMVEMVDLSRQNVANYVGQTIGSNSISPTYQPAIVNFSKADTIDMMNAQVGGGTVKLAELTVDDQGEQMTAEQYRLLADKQLANLGRKIRFARSVS